MADGQDTVMLWMLIPHHVSAVNPCWPNQWCGTTETAWLYAGKADLWTHWETSRFVFMLEALVNIALA